jgi:PAS domain S-box-containing protein
MSAILLASIVLRVVGVVYSLSLLYRVRDRRFGFLTLMLALMAVRQMWTYGVDSGGLDELPGLLVSVLAVLSIVFLAQYVDQEERFKSELREKNETLRGFRQAIEHAGHGIFITEPDGTITYANPAIESLTGFSPEEVIGENPRLWKSGKHDEAFYEDMWSEITAGNVWDGEIINEHRGGDLCWVDMTIAPIEDETGDVEGYVAVDTDITERKERELQIQRQNRRLEILNNTNEILRDVNRELVQAGTREAVEQAVCERFADAGPYEFAWIGDVSVVNGSLRAHTWSGIDEADLGDVLVSPAGMADGRTLPAQEAIDAQETIFTRDLGDVGTDAWREAVEAQGCDSLVSIPLCYRDACYGVLEVFASDAEALEEIKSSVFAELGATVAYAVNAVESKQALLQDRVTELGFDVRGEDCWFTGVGEKTGARLELERLAADDDGTVVEYFTVSGADPDDVVAAAVEHATVREGQVVSRGDEESLCRFEVDESGIAGALAEYGAVVESMVAEGGEGHVEATVSRRSDVRAVVEGVQQVHPAANLVAQRERERGVQTEHEFRAALKDRLTPRQREALETAYLGGFFEWPRDSTGEEIAEVMGISQSTFLQHLRAGKRKLLAELLDDTVSERPATDRAV